LAQRARTESNRRDNRSRDLGLGRRWSKDRSCANRDSQRGLGRAIGSASSRQRRRACFLRSRADVVPMHRMQRFRPSGTSAGRPERSSRVRLRRRSHPGAKRKRQGLGAVGCQSSNPVIQPCLAADRSRRHISASSGATPNTVPAGLAVGREERRANQGATALNSSRLGRGRPSRGVSPQDTPRSACTDREKSGGG
jgi:hypothetical protein